MKSSDAIRTVKKVIARRRVEERRGVSDHATMSLIDDVLENAQHEILAALETLKQTGEVE